MIQDYIKDSFNFIRRPGKPEILFEDSLIVESDRLSQAIDYINLNAISCITITSESFELDSLDFLKLTPSVQALYCLKNEMDVASINSLSELRLLVIGPVKQNINLDNFPKLEVLSCMYSRFIKEISSCEKLYWLWIEGYKENDLTGLRNLTNLKYLNLDRSSIKTLEGIEDMASLQYILLDTMPHLESLKGLNSNHKKLEILDIWLAKRLTNYEHISNVRSLRQLELRRTGDTGSIDFLRGLPHLNRVTLGFKVLDGDMDCLKGIESVGFIDFPHYSHRMNDFKKKE